MGISAFNKSLFNSAAFVPVVQSNFSAEVGDYSTLSTLSSMPAGGSVSRAGQAMVYDSTGKLTYAPANMAQYSQKLATFPPWGTASGTVTVTEDTSDTTAPDGTSTANKVMEVNAASTPRVAQTTTVPIGSKIIISIYAKANGRTQVRIVAEGSAGNSAYFTLSGSGSTTGVGASTTANITSVGNGWYRCSIAYTATTTTQAYIATAEANAPISSGDSTKGVFLWGYQVEAVTYQTTPGPYVATTSAAYYGPRFDYDPATLAAKGLLVEGTRTNIAPYSQNFSSWSTGRLNALTSATSPDGTSNAVFMSEDTTAGNHQLYYGSFSRGSTSALPYTFSVYAKSTQRRLRLVIFNGSQGSQADATFDLVNGQVGIAAAVSGSYTSPSAKIENAGSGWYRCSLTFTTDTNGSFFQYLYLDKGTGTGAANNSYTGDGSSGAYVFGVQIEQATFASSYVPNTSTSTTTRAAETFTITGYANRLVEAYWIEQETGVSSSFPETVVSSGAVTISPPTFGWVTSLRAYTNAYAGDIAVPSWLDNSGTTGNRMYTDSTGTLTWAPANLLLNSATLSTQTVTGGVAAGGDYILSFKGTGSVAISGGHTATLAGTGANDRVSLKFSPTTASLTFTVTGSVTEAQLERVTYQTTPRPYIPTTAAVYQPRFDYDASTFPATPLGLRIEESRANLLLQSQTFNTTWSPVNVTVNSDVITAPDGTTTADFIVPTTTGGVQHRIDQSVSITSGTTYTFSVYVKLGGYNEIQLRTANDTGNVVFYPLTGVVTVLGGSGSMTNVGNGWYRLVVTGTATATGTSQNRINVTSASFAGDGVSGLYVWGAQLEAGSFATSYIPTTTASVTRAADVVKLTGSALTTLQGAQATMIVETGTISSSSDTFISGRKSSTGLYNDYLYCGASYSSITVGGSAQAVLTYSPAVSLPATVRAAFAFQDNNFAAVSNNGTVQKDTSGSVISGLNEAYLGCYVNAAFQNGWTRSAALYNQRLPDAILKQKSAVGAAY